MGKWLITQQLLPIDVLFNVDVVCLFPHCVGTPIIVHINRHM